LASVRQRLGGPGASRRAAEAILDLVNSRRHQARDKGHRYDENLRRRASPRADALSCVLPSGRTWEHHRARADRSRGSDARFGRHHSRSHRHGKFTVDRRPAGGRDTRDRGRRVVAQRTVRQGGAVSRAGRHARPLSECGRGSPSIRGRATRDRVSCLAGSQISASGWLQPGRIQGDGFRDRIGRRPGAERQALRWRNHNRSRRSRAPSAFTRRLRAALAGAGGGTTMKSSAAACIALILLGPIPARAYMKFGVQVGNRQVELKWAQSPVRYFVSDRGAPGVGAKDLQGAVRRAFTKWREGGAGWRTYQFAGFTAALPLDEDGLSTIGFAPRPDLDRVLA